MAREKILIYATIERLAETMKEGAYDLLTKPFDADHLCIVIETALGRQKVPNDSEAKR